MCLLGCGQFRHEKIGAFYTHAIGYATKIPISHRRDRYAKLGGQLRSAVELSYSRVDQGNFLRRC